MRSSLLLLLLFVIVGTSGVTPSGRFFAVPTTHADQDYTVVLQPHDASQPSDGNQPAHDVTLIGGNDTTHGGDDWVYVGDSSVGSAHAIQEFNLGSLPTGGSIPSNATIKSATMRLTNLFWKGGGGVTSTYAFVTMTRMNVPDGIWNENATTWLRYDQGRTWVSPGGDGDTSLRQTLGGRLNSQPNYGYFNFDIKNFAQDAVQNRGGKLQLLMTAAQMKVCTLGVCVPIANSDFFSYQSGEYLSNPGFTPLVWPRLTVTYTVPDPKEISGRVWVDATHDPLTQNATVQLETKNAQGDWEIATDPVTHREARSQTKDTWSFRYDVNAQSAAYDYRVVVDPPVGFASGPTLPNYGTNCSAPSNRRPDALEWVGAKRLSKNGCTSNYFSVSLPHGGPQISGYKFNDLDSDGIKDSNEVGVPGFTIRLYEEGAPQAVDSRVTSADAATLGKFQFTGLKANKKYRIEEVTREGWQQTSSPDAFALAQDRPERAVGNHVVGGGLQSDIINLSKTPTVSPLPTSQSETQVVVTFTVTEGGAKNVVIREILADHLTLASRDATFNGAPFTLPSGASTSFDFQPTDTVGSHDLAAGDYTLTFSVKYDGPLDVDQPIDSKKEDCLASARIEFKDAADPTHTNCRTIPAGAIKKLSSAGQLILKADAWIGNKAVTVTDKLRIGNDTLVISGGDINGRTGGLSVPNYSLPTTGKAVWQQLEALMNQRVASSISKKIAQSAPCPNGVPELYLNGVNLASSTVDGQAQKIWDLNRCELVLGNVTIHGSGTFVNVGRVIFKGKMAASPESSTLGLVSNSDVVVCPESAVKNAAIFTTKEIQFADSDASVCH